MGLEDMSVRRFAQGPVITAPTIASKGKPASADRPGFTVPGEVGASAVQDGSTRVAVTASSITSTSRAAAVRPR
jgi:hypothetical protein